MNTGETIQGGTSVRSGPGGRGWVAWQLSAMLFMGLLVAASQSFAGTQNQWPVGMTFAGWPSDSTWLPLTSLNDPATDVGTTASVLNLVGDALNPGFYWAQGGGYLFFRMRVNSAAAVTQPSCTSFPTGCTSAAPFSNAGTLWLFIQPDGVTTPVPRYGICWDFKNPSVEVHGLEMARFKGFIPPSSLKWKDINMEDSDEDQGARINPDFNSPGRPGVTSVPYSGTDGYIRTVDGVARVTGAGNTAVTDVTTFVDFAISCSYLNYLQTYTAVRTGNGKFELVCGQTWRLQLASTAAADNGAVDFDVAGGVTNINVSPYPEVSTPATSLPGQITSSATYAVLEGFGASVRGGKVVVQWDTQAEMGTAGFELARMDAEGAFVPLHEDLIAGQNPAGEGGHYRFVDPTALPGWPATYRLVEVESNGNRREVGQYTVTPQAPAQAKSAQAAEREPEPVGGQAEFTPRSPTAQEIARVKARQGERARAHQSSQVAMAKGIAAPLAGKKPTTANRVALAVREPGLYQVTSGALASAFGLPESQVSKLIKGGQFRLNHHGTAIAWQALDKDQGLLFYGAAANSIYDPDNVYVLEAGAGLTMDTVKVSVKKKDPPGAASFDDTVTFEENLFAATVMAKDPEEDYWFWASFMGGVSRAFTLVAPNAAGSGSGRLQVWLRGFSSLAATPDHHVRVSLNGTLLGDGQWDGLTDYRLDLPVDGTLLRPDGQNQIELQALNDAGVAYNYFYLDRFALTYPRRYQANGDHLLATGPAGQILVASGFNSNAIRVFDLSDPTRPKSVSGAVVDGDPGNYRVSLVPADVTIPYLLVSDAAILSPRDVRTMASLPAPGNGAAYLLIGPDDFDQDASQPVQRLLDLRAAQGLSTRFVPLQALYDTYGDGQKDPRAIQRFLSDARAWPTPPAYVLLAGKGTFDPKDYLDKGTDRLPVLMALTPDIGVIAADQRFVDFNGDGLGDLPIGRLPAVTAAEFAAMVDKLIAYEDDVPPFARKAILVADGPDSGGNYTANSEATAEWLLDAGLAETDLQRLYVERMSPANVRLALRSGLGVGADLLNYYGHAGVTALDHGLLSVADATALTTTGPLPVVLGMTCLMNRFEYPQLISLGEALLLNPHGGAAAVWSSGGYSYDSSSWALNDAFFDAALGQGAERLGDAVQYALGDAAQTCGPDSAPAVYNLLGDPATLNRLQ